MTIWRRSSRSISTPLKGSTAIAGKVVSTKSHPSEISEWVFCRMYQVTPAEFMPLPNIEIMLARNTNRSGLCCKILRITNDFRVLDFDAGPASRMRFSECAIIRPRMIQRSSRFLWIAAMVVLVSAIVLVAAERRQQRPVTTAYFSDTELQVQPIFEKGARTFNYGPWPLVSIVPGDKGSDHRFNLYVIAPGLHPRAPPPADEFNNAVLINS